MGLTPKLECVNLIDVWHYSSRRCDGLGQKFNGVVPKNKLGDSGKTLKVISEPKYKQAFYEASLGRC